MNLNNIKSYGMGISNIMDYYIDNTYRINMLDDNEIPESGMEIIDRFNHMEGKLRISVTHACQLQCQFCHREGIDPHWVPVHISLNYFRDLIKAYSSIGGLYIELTGGEPLCHPEIQNLVEIGSSRRRHLIICTNGLLLNKIQTQLEAGLVHQIKLSLHSTSNSSVSKRLLRCLGYQINRT